MPRLLLTVAVVLIRSHFMSHLRGLRDALSLPGALRVAEAAAGLHAAAGFHRQVETQRDLRGCGGAHAQHTYNRTGLLYFLHSLCFKSMSCIGMINP